ncbi:MAG: glycosyltransferase [Bryobacterales bacterium]|nr:glycosyltransferase [Bryobacterales bacterium]
MEPHTISVTELDTCLDGADVVFVHQCLSATGLFAAAHAKLRGKWTFGLDHGGGEHPLAHHSPEIGRLFDAFLAQSNFGASSFEDIEGRVAVIKGPVDSTYYSVNPQVRRDSSLILAVGRVLPHKGIDRIVPLIPEDARLVVAGSCYDQDYGQYLRQMPAASRLEIREGLSDAEIRTLMQEASLFIQASTHFDYRQRYYAKPELLGLAALEALCCGTPTLVSSAGSLPELSSIRGCTMFHGDGELGALIRGHFSRQPGRPDADEISRDARAKYGLEAYGHQLLTLMAEMGAWQ